MSFSLLIQIGSHQSLLECLVESLKKTEYQRSKFSVGVQTFEFGQAESLEKKLESIEWSFKSKMENDKVSSIESYNEKIVKIKRELDDRYKKDLAIEVSRFKQFEVSAIRMQEADKNRKERETLRDELEKSYFSKLESLRERERNALESFKQKSKEIETKDHSYRKTISNDLEFIRLREEEIEKMRLLNEESVKLEKEKLNKLQLEFEAKIKAVDNEKSKEKMSMEHEIAHAKLEILKDLEHDRLDVSKKKAELTERLSKIEVLQEKNKHLQERNTELAAENSKFSKSYTETKARKRDLENELSSLKDTLQKLANASQKDTHSSKELENRISTLLQEKELLSSSLAEHKAIIEELKAFKYSALKDHQREVQKYQEMIESLQSQVKAVTLAKAGNPASSVNEDYEMVELRRQREASIKALQEESSSSELLTKLERMRNEGSKNILKESYTHFEDNAFSHSDPTTIFKL